ncbi:MAG TPA: hypothetical protein VMR97_13800 [Acidimicrobiales bacterium]|nr:hypothetical protein [Acidimicrobiales bacterium]
MGQPGTEHLDPRELLESLRREHRALRWEPLLPSDELHRWHEHPMRDEESLAYLHRHWRLPDSFSKPGATEGFRDRIARRLGGLMFRTLQPYLHAERELMANLVRMNDALAKRCDDLAKVIAERQVADAENQAKLAALVHDTVASADEGAAPGLAR